MRVPGPCLAAVLVTAAACEEDQNTLVTAPDAVVLDTGQSDPIPLMVGMELTYSAVLTRRETETAEVSGQYRVVVRITEVTDNDDGAPSRLRFTMTDVTPTTSPNWSAQADFDSWIGRLGPGVDRDVVDETATEMVLDGAPALPDPPSPTKTLPVPSSFFVDIRRTAEIGADWTETESGRMPSVDVVGQGDVAFALDSSGDDERLEFHGPRDDPGTRRITLEYADAGFLEGLDETIAAPTGFPQTTARLNRIDGP